ncbi:LysR family transcriptional regulator [Leisingera aquaemixtae]|uniref:Cat operon transcriptional regulator n=1 Tax=Leisingera aquaemixtae TaxID=1396826 RepID=A0A0P1HEG9_9RHOB|nr:LysR family transcriptional regulator [Leisingera aquaemixtae]CUI02181.1 Cat operon transcriptional regulator [Leisingera aquaemixtae]
MDIELARTFLAVAETGSFLEAAKRVHVAQSTVSLRIRALEQQLGRSLFDRSKTGAALTEAGRHFQRHAQTLARTWMQAKLDAALPAGMETVLAVGAPSSLWDGFLTGALPGLRRALPEVAVRASAMASDALVQLFGQGGLDLMVAYRPKAAAGLAVEQLFEDEFVLVSSDPDTSTDPFGTEYVLVDWGPEFRADHLLVLPDIRTPGFQLDIGTLALQHLRNVPASAYFPKRLVAADLRAGWLRRIEGAPRFGYSAYAVISEGQRGEYAGQAVQFLRQYALGGGTVERDEAVGGV